jgi:hypothetical protein
MGLGLSLAAQAQGEINLAVKQRSTDRVFTELSTSGIKVSLLVLDRQDEFTLKTPADNPVQIIFDKSGQIRDIKNTAALEEQNRLNFSVLDMLRNYLPTLPARPLAIGESWQDHKKMQVPFQGMNLTINIEITFTLNDVVQTPEGRLAFIGANFAVDLSGERPVAEVEGAFTGNGKGTGFLYFLVDAGYFTEYRADYNVNGAMVMRKGETKLAEWPFTLTESTALSFLGKVQ